MLIDYLIGLCLYVSIMVITVTGSINAQTFRQMDPSLPFALRPTKRFTIHYPLACASQCLGSPGCGVYGVTPLGNGLSECVLTGGGTLLDVSDLTDIVWYAQEG